MSYSQKLLQANNAQVTLAAAMNTTVTSITLGSGQGALFPNPSAGQAFVATLTAAGTTTDSPNEIVLCTARSGDTLTIVRAQEGTTAANWSIGDNFGNWNTAGTMEQFAQLTDLQSQFTNSAADSGTANLGAVALSPVPLAMSQLLYAPITVLKTSSPNTGAYQLNVNALGAVAVQYKGSALIAGDLPASQLFTVRYDGSVFELLSPPGNVRGAAGGDLTGTYPNPTIAANAVSAAKLFQGGANTILANITGSTANFAAVGISAFLAFLGFTTSFSAANSSVNFFGLFIIKFGISLSTSGGGQTVTFTTPFPNTCYGVVMSPLETTLAASINLNSGTVVASGFNYQTFISGTGAGPLNCYWIAVGN